jgi:hypothetical protein
MAKGRKVSEQLREAVETCGLSRYRIWKETGITQSTLSRFVRGHAALDLESVDALAAFLGLELRAAGTVKRKASQTRRASR